jgi:hypothetical protein
MVFATVCSVENIGRIYIYNCSGQKHAHYAPCAAINAPKDWERSDRSQSRNLSVSAVVSAVLSAVLVQTGHGFSRSYDNFAICCFRIRERKNPFYIVLKQLHIFWDSLRESNGYWDWTAWNIYRKLDFAAFWIYSTLNGHCYKISGKMSTPQRIFTGA